MKYVTMVHPTLHAEQAASSPTTRHVPHHMLCDLTISAGGRHCDLAQVEVSAGGVAKLPSTPSLGELLAGQRIDVRVQAGPLGTSRALTVPARIVLERTLGESSYGIAFDWTGHDLLRQALVRALAERGFAPAPNRRKHERTIADAGNPVFPLAARIRVSDGSVLDAEATAEPATWLSRIKNLSPAGILLSSDDPGAAPIKPGDGLHVIIQPRDTQGFTIEAIGNVRRVLEHVEPTALGERIVRSFGLRFEWIDEDQRTIYLSLLKCIGADLEPGAK
jgi:hypothetical protein